MIVRQRKSRLMGEQYANAKTAPHSIADSCNTAVPKPDESEGPRNGKATSMVRVVQTPNHRPHFLKKNRAIGGTMIATSDTAERDRKTAGLKANGAKASLVYAAVNSSETCAGKYAASTAAATSVAM